MTRRTVLSGLAAITALSTAACATGSSVTNLAAQNPPPARGEAKLAKGENGGDAMIMADGARLPLVSWMPEGEIAAVILAAHGFNDYSHAFYEPAKFLTRHGVAVYAYDQRGFGRAPGVGRWPGADMLVDDLCDAARLIATQHPGKPFYLMGESMGGAEVMIALARPDAPACDGAVLAAPAVWDRDHMNVFERAALWLSDRIAPGMKLTGSGLNIVPCDNLRIMREMWKDPLIIKETRADAIAGLVDLMDEAQLAAGQLRVPTLMLYGAHDQLVPPAPTYKAMSLMTHGTTIAYYQRGYHMLLRDLEADTVLGDIAAWVKEPGTKLPSGADGLGHTELAAYLASHVAG